MQGNSQSATTKNDNCSILFEYQKPELVPPSLEKCTNLSTDNNGNESVKMNSNRVCLISASRKMHLVALVGMTLMLSVGVALSKATHSRLTDSVYKNVVKRQLSRFSGKDSFTLKEIVNNVYRPESWNATWVSDTEYIYRNRNGLQIFSVVTAQSQTIMPNAELVGVFKYWLSPDQKHVLLAIRPQKLFRHSFIAIYDIYNIRSGQRTKLQPSGSVLRQLDGPALPPADLDGPSQLPLLFAKWAPVGSSIAYVFSNNIFYRNSPSDPDVAITTTGVPGTVFNGIADWVYEEEVISDTRALWFSPDGRNLAWIEFNDTSVDVMPLQIYGAPSRLEFQYPIPTPLRYPKPGRTNPFVNVYTASVSRAAANRKSPAPILLQAPTYFRDKQKIIYAVTWATDTEVSLTWENRHQNYSIVSICDVTTTDCRDSLVMTEPNGWMELDQAPVFTKDGRQFVMVLSADGYKHVNVINRNTNQRVPITSGEMVVTKIYHWDEKAHVIYFKGTRKGAPGERHLYTVTDFESGKPGVVTCLSCDMVNTNQSPCGYNSFEFSTEKTYYTMSCKGPHVPQDYLYKAPSTKVATLITNDDLSTILADKHLPKVSNLDVSIANGRFVAKVRLYLPHDFDERKKYPLLVNVYAGPNSQRVNDRFKLDWGTYLATSEDVIYAIIDGRGSGYRGDDLLFEIYYNLGQAEVQDQIEVTQKLINLYSFIDRDNVAIWGWSYGGFVTLSALAADTNNIFKCGIAVAPVTNWIYYDTIYTERYMGLPNPNDNLRGYRASDISAKVDQLRGKKMLLVHGTADDNVHYQQTMMLTLALEQANILFQQLSYPDENHGIVSLRPHFYRSLTNFILNDCFNKNVAVKKK